MIIKSAISVVLLLGIIVFVTWNFGLAPTFGALQQLSLFTLGTAFVALLANAVAAALRFRTIAGDIGHTIGLRKALAAVSVGTLAGSAFFQLAGQLMARGVMMSRGGIPFASVVVMTLYERAVAAIISGLLALAGAYYIFGQIAVDQQTGGNNFIKIVIGLLAAATAGALLGYGRRAANAISPVMTGHFAVRLVRAIGLSLLVQLPMMAGYIIIAHALSPDVSLSELAAAASLVMFAASVPVSFAGWGIREMSAVFALGAIGVGAAKAVVTALLIGAGSLIAMAALAILSVTSWNQSAPTTAERTSPPIDYMKLLMWSLPVATAFLVLFQIYVPISSGTLLNVNLADPVVILGGSIFLLQSITQQSPPQWRIPHLNLAIGAMTVVLAISLIAGAARFGYTEWAVVNRFLGWFVLLAYAATGALVIKAAGREGFDTILLTFVAATAAIVAIEFALVIIESGGIHISLPVVKNEIQGFAQNRNSFAFQILMALSAAIVAVHNSRTRVLLIATFMVGLWWCGSRSGWGTAIILILGSLYLRAATVAEMASAILLAIVAGLSPLVTAFLANLAALLVHLWNGTYISHYALLPHIDLPEIAPSAADHAERLLSIKHGWELFITNPIFGAGLGAFRNLGIPSSSGVPLIIHSTPLWIMAEMGLVGLVVFAWPALYILFAEFRRKKRDSASQLVVLCLVAFAVMAMPADMFYQRTFWFLIGAGLAMRAPVEYEW